MSSLPASFDASTLFATEHGAVEWAEGGSLRLRLGRLEATLSASEVVSLHEATRALAGDVYRCGQDCRWQLRMPDRSVFVLSTDEVLRLSTLLDGAVAMLELDDILAGASVDRANRREGRKMEDGGIER